MAAAAARYARDSRQVQGASCRFMHLPGHAAAGLCQFAEVEGGLVPVGEADDHAGGAADGLEVGVEGRQDRCACRLAGAVVPASAGRDGILAGCQNCFR